MLYLQINLVADFALMHEAHHDNEDEPCIINASTPLIGPLLSFSTYLQCTGAMCNVILKHQMAAKLLRISQQIFLKLYILITLSVKGINF